VIIVCDFYILSYIIMTETKQNIGFWDIVKTMEPRWAMSSMATWAVGILSFLVWKFLNLWFVKILGGILVYLAILFIILFAIFFILRIIKFPQEVLKDLKHPIAANFFAWIFISLAVIVSGVLNVLNPLGWFLWTVDVAKFFYILALIVGLIVPVIVPFMLTISENVDTKHAVWIWYLPPVWIFVLVFAGNFLALHWVWVSFIGYLNIFLMWVAFMLYLLVSALIYYRLKFHPLPAPEVAPSFVIGLAPVGVSVIAINTYYQLINKFHLLPWNMDVVHTLLSIVSTMLYGFGFWWAIITILIIWYYLFKHSLPFTLWWWAFVFPVAAFGIWLKFIALDVWNKFFDWIMFVDWIIVLVLWILVFCKTLIWIYTKKAFMRPKVVK